MPPCLLWKENRGGVELTLPPAARWSPLGSPSPRARAELAQLKLSELKRRAVLLGVEPEHVHSVDDAEDPKAAGARSTKLI